MSNFGFIVFFVNKVFRHKAIKGGYDIGFAMDFENIITVYEWVLTFSYAYQFVILDNNVLEPRKASKFLFKGKK